MSDQEREHLEDLADLMIYMQDDSSMRQRAVDAHEFATRPFKVVLRVLSDGRPMPGVVSLFGVRTVKEMESTIRSGVGATWLTYADDPDIALEVIVLNQDFQRERYFIKSIKDCAPSS